MRPRLQILAAAFLFSTGGAAIKATSLSNWQVAGFRSLVAAITILLLIPDSRRNWTRGACAIAVAYALTLVTFVTATKLTTSANAIFLQSTCPLYLLVLGPLLLKERTRRIDVLFMSLLAVGLACIFFGHEAAQATAPDPAAGNLVALFSGVAYAFTLAGMRWISTRSAIPTSSISTVAIGNLFASLICAPFAFPVTHFSLSDAGAILYLGIFQISLAYLLLGAGMRYVPAVESGTLILAEPALNPLWTWLLHHERPSLWALAGGALILLGAGLRPLFGTRS